MKSGRNHARAVNSRKRLYPQLVVRNFPGLAAFFVEDQRSSVIDVMYPHRADLAETLANSIWIENEEQGLRYRIPSLEEAMANKCGAMLNPSRELDQRMQDAVDFTRMVGLAGNEGSEPINLDRLVSLGEMVWPGGGGKEILQFVERVKSGKAIQLPGT